MRQPTEQSWGGRRKPGTARCTVNAMRVLFLARNWVSTQRVHEHEESELWKEREERALSVVWTLGYARKIRRRRSNERTRLWWQSNQTSASHHSCLGNRQRRIQDDSSIRPKYTNTAERKKERKENVVIEHQWCDDKGTDKKLMKKMKMTDWLRHQRKGGISTRTDEADMQTAKEKIETEPPTTFLLRKVNLQKSAPSESINNYVNRIITEVITRVYLFS